MGFEYIVHESYKPSTYIHLHLLKMSQDESK